MASSKAQEKRLAIAKQVIDAQLSIVQEVEPIHFLLSREQLVAYCELQSLKCYTEQVNFLACISGNKKLILSSYICLDYHGRVGAQYILELRNAMEERLLADFIEDGRTHSVYGEFFQELWSVLLLKNKKHTDKDIGVHQLATIAMVIFMRIQEAHETDSKDIKSIFHSNNVFFANE